MVKVIENEDQLLTGHRKEARQGVTAALGSHRGGNHDIFVAATAQNNSPASPDRMFELFHPVWSPTKLCHAHPSSMLVNDPLALGTALVLGLSHALEVDHMIAVTTFVARRPSASRAVSFGARWGLGHSASVVAMGAVLLSLGVSMPAKLEAAAEGLVGVVLVALGFWALRSSGKLSGEAEDGQQTGDRHGVGWVGLLHGLAGTGGVIALVPVTMVDRTATGIGYLVAFSLGVTMAMSGFAVVAAAAMRRSNENSIELGRAMIRTVGAVGMAVGFWWILRFVG